MWVVGHAVFLALLLTACAEVPQGDRGPRPASPSTHLFDAATVIEDQWEHFPLRGKTDYRLAILDGRVAIRAEGRRSASGLIRRVSIDLAKCPTLEWTWAVAKMQHNANLHLKNREDVAASIFLLFGDPGFLFDPKPVPTIRYVWTNGAAPVGSVIDNPYLPGTVKNIVVESGAGRIGEWVTERRSILKDYVLAFGSEPETGIYAVALFTDNDQTEEPVEAYYGSGRAVCKP